MEIVTASQLVSLLEICYTLIVDYLESGAERRPAKATEEELRQLAKPAVAQWGKQFPSLRDAVNTALAGRNKAEQLALLGQEIKEQFPELRKNERFTAEELEVLNALGAYLRTDSEPALMRIKKMAGIVSNPFISQFFAPKAGTQDKSSDSLRRVVKKLVGRDDIALSIDESNQAKELHPDLYKAYLALRREYNQVWKDSLVSYVRNSGKPRVPYQEVLSHLKANNLSHLLSEGFTGHIDDRGKLYTPEGHAIDGAPNAVTFPSVEMNKNYGKAGGDNWVMRAVRNDGSPGPHYYTTDFKKAQAREKFQKVAELSGKIESMQRKWFQLVRKFNMQDPKSVGAVVLEVLYEFSARIGTPGNSTFGIATLQVRHVSIDSAGNIVLRYKGKDEVPFKHVLMASDPVQKYVVAAIHQLMADKAPKDKLFTFIANGRMRPVTPAMVNAEFKAFGAEGVTVHKLRTFRGTALFRELMESITKPPKDEKACLDLFNKMAEAVGKKLNHVRRTSTGTKVTGMTAINNYISPELMVAYFREMGFRPPKFLEKFDTGSAE